MTIKLTEGQMALLRSGAEREDYCLDGFGCGKGGAAKKSAMKLMELRLVREIKAKEGSPVFRKDGGTGQVYALKLTATGRKAIAPPEGGESKTSAMQTQPHSSELAREAVEESRETDGPIRPRSGEPREGSKLASVIKLLDRETGATIDELAGAMGWLPHTTRAALTSLRKRGISILRQKGAQERARAYVRVKESRADGAARR